MGEFNRQCPVIMTRTTKIIKIISVCLNLDFHGKENSFYWHKRMSRPLIETRSTPVQLYSKKDYQILFSKNSLLSDKDILSNEPGKFDRKKKFIIMRTDLLVSASN